MNQNYLNRQKNEFSLDEEILINHYESDEELDLYWDRRKRRKGSESSTTVTSGINHPNTISYEDYQFSEEFLSQNIINFDQTIKLMILGEKNVGKTTLVNKIISPKVTNPQSNQSTTILEIKKTIINKFDKHIKLELWDIPYSTLNNEMLKIYYNILNGFVIIINPNITQQELANLKQQIDKIRLINNKSQILVIVNTKGKDDLNYQEINEDLKEISKDYKIDYCIIDLTSFDISDSLFSSFLKEVSVQKSILLASKK